MRAQESRVGGARCSASLYGPGEACRAPKTYFCLICICVCICFLLVAISWSARAYAFAIFSSVHFHGPSFDPCHHPRHDRPTSAFLPGRSAAAATAFVAAATRQQMSRRGGAVQSYPALPGDEALVEAHRRVQGPAMSGTLVLLALGVGAGVGGWSGSGIKFKCP